jgi:hypothetical protein
MHKLILVQFFLAPVLGQTPFSSITGGTPNTGQTLVVGSGSSLAATGTGTINATFQNNGPSAQLNPLAVRLQTSGYAYPDFCTVVDGTVFHDNTPCLTSALGALGTSFGVLEIPAPGATTSSNYYCTSLGTTWAAAQSRVHIWKGASLSCALPPADATHIIQDDNLASINPWPSAGLPSNVGPAIYVCISGCSIHNDMTSGGLYTSTGTLVYGVQISATGTPDSFSWGSQTCSDTTDTVSFSAGERWAVAYNTGTASDGSANARVSFQCQ